VKKVHHAYQIELETALRAALYAGDYFRSRIDHVQTVKMKSSPSDLVTEVDPFCERLIRDTIHRRFDGDFILGEESVAPGARAASEAITDAANRHRLWIVDPLDGTNNFVSGIPLSVVSIAFAVEGVTQIGVVYDPYRKEMFLAVRGLCMWIAKDFEIRNWLENVCMDKLPGVKSKVTDCEQLKHAVIATGFPVRGAEKDTATLKSLQIAKQVRSFRALGAAALHLAYVGAGRIDLFWEYELNAWDIAAGMLLVEEAGGIVRQLDGRATCLKTRNVLAAGTRELLNEFDAVF
jgi:myo-inositol-1(or 4)-monophosphatase